MNKLLIYCIASLSIGISHYSYANNTSSCNANEGLQLLNQPNRPLQQISDILAQCDKQIPNDVQVLLLHGLLAREQGMANKNYPTAIDWLEKAKAAAAANNPIPALELAITYEWARQPDKAKLIYDQLLVQTPNSRAALLGSARVARTQNRLQDATHIYQEFLQKNPADTEALDGLAWIKLANKEYAVAKEDFTKVQSIKPDDAEARIGLEQINQATQPKPQPIETPVVTCKANDGLQLLNQKKPPIPQIKAILDNCDKETPKDVQVLLLHGLLARKEGMAKKQYQIAIDWLQKAKEVATPENFTPALELAITYEWMKQPKKAKAIYDQILKQEPNSRAALLGAARVAQTQNRLQDASHIYQKLLTKNTKDTEALNGLAWVNLAKKEYKLAKKGFETVLLIKKNDADALSGLQKVNKAIQLAQVKKRPPLCEANKGLLLLNKPNPPITQIDAILAKCDKNTPNDVQALLLHGLLARKQGSTTHNYQAAIDWLQKAQAAATPNNASPALELAVTYEWNNQPKKAKLLYDKILTADPNSRAASLGAARVARTQYRLKDATTIYETLLQKNSVDTDALDGLGWVNFVNKKFKPAKMYFEEAQRLKPDDADARIGLEDLKIATRYMVSATSGFYSVDSVQSIGSNLLFTGYINATDQLIALAVHNTKEIGANFFTTPTLLPKNSLSFGFQRQIPNEYGWGINYDYRERTQLPLENRIAINGNVYLLSNLQWFAGIRDGFPSPWKNQLYSSGLTLFTNAPANISLTGFWGHDEIGGRDDSYSFDFSKEFTKHSFYDVGIAYSPTVLTHPSWQIHGRFIWGLFKNQALEAACEHYFFNTSTFIIVGWRVYW